MARPPSHHTESTRLWGADEGMPLMFEEKLSDSLKCLLKKKKIKKSKNCKSKFSYKMLHQLGEKMSLHHSVFSVVNLIVRQQVDF